MRTEEHELTFGAFTVGTVKEAIRLYFDPLRAVAAWIWKQVSAAQRIREAEAAFQKALSSRRELAKANPEAYLPAVATTLNNLAILYRDTQRMKEAEAALQEALSIGRELEKANPEDYLRSVEPH